MFRFPRTLSMLVLIPAIAVASGCGSGVHFVRTDPHPYPARDAGAPVEVYTGSVAVPHVVIGTLTARRTMDAAFNDRSTYDELIAQLQRHARKVGADALIEVRPVPVESSGGGSRLEVSAQAVRYLQPAVTVRSRDS